MNIHIFDKFGNEHIHNIDHYVWELPVMNLYVMDEVGIITEIVGDSEKKRAGMKLMGVYLDIIGFSIEAQDERESK